jgi:hypothetical protein
MKISGGLWIASLLIALASAGCARIVTVEPETVASRNDKAWTVRRAPTAGAPATAAAAPAPAPAPVGPPAASPAGGVVPAVSTGNPSK